jgi:hypothetical protein
MYKYLALAVIIASMTVNAHYVDTKTILAEIDADNFGNSVLSTV